MLSVKLQAREYVAVFADIVDKLIKSMVGDMDKKEAKLKEGFSLVLNGDYDIPNLKRYGVISMNRILHKICL